MYTEICSKVTYYPRKFSELAKDWATNFKWQGRWARDEVSEWRYESIKGSTSKI